MHAHRTSARRFVAIVAVALTVAGLTACSRSDDTAGPLTPAGGSTTSSTEKPAGKPKPGGEITVGLDAETNDFNPATGQWSPSSYAVANALFDPLVAIDDQGNVVPYLAQSITANPAYTEWVFKLRPGVTFHDGTPLNAAAVKRNLDNVKSSALTGQAFVAIDSITATDDQTVTIEMNRPWATFSATLSTQSGYIVAPSMLDDPAGGNANIVGSGPFTFVSRQRDASLKTKKNPAYWQKDGDGVALPYLDGLSFQIVTDPSARANALASGDLNAELQAAASQLQKAQQQAEQGELQRISNERSETDESVFALNTTKEPFNDPIARQALAYGTDQNEMAQIAWQGAVPGAWGMFDESSPYYITPQEAGYPAHDVEKAKSLVKEYEQKHGKPLEFTTLTLANPDTIAVMQAYQADMATYGVKMNIESVETTQLISRVIVSGDYEASIFVLWSSPTPDQGYVFVATPPNPNGISLNYTRFDDPPLTKAMDDFRATGDPKARIEAMKTVQKELAKNLQVIFLSHARGTWLFGNNVHGFTVPVAPGTDKKVYNPYPTTPFYTYVWKDQ